MDIYFLHDDIIGVNPRGDGGYIPPNIWQGGDGPLYDPPQCFDRVWDKNELYTVWNPVTESNGNYVHFSQQFHWK